MKSPDVGYFGCLDVLQPWKLAALQVLDERPKYLVCPSQPVRHLAPI